MKQVKVKFYEKSPKVKSLKNGDIKIRFNCRYETIPTYCHSAFCPFKNETEFGTICNMHKYSKWKDFDTYITIKRM